MMLKDVMLYNSRKNAPAVLPHSGAHRRVIFDAQTAYHAARGSDLPALRGRLRSPAVRPGIGRGQVLLPHLLLRDEDGLRHAARRRAVLGQGQPAARRNDGRTGRRCLLALDGLCRPPNRLRTVQRPAEGLECPPLGLSPVRWQHHAGLRTRPSLPGAPLCELAPSGTSDPRNERPQGKGAKRPAESGGSVPAWTRGE